MLERDCWIYLKKNFIVVKDGIILVNKPKGITSHDVVDVVRRKLGVRRVGHTGTLDPLATGVLVILVGRATKLFAEFSSVDKKYSATLRLGVFTSTGDIEGSIVAEKDYKGLSPGEIKKVFAGFEGEMFQAPPMFSALRYKGRRLYELARSGKTVKVTPRRIYIYSLKIESIRLPFVDFNLHCSKGTYVRKIAEDIGEELKCGACIENIKRTAVGGITIDQCINLEDITEDKIQDPDLYIRAVKLRPSLIK